MHSQSPFNHIKIYLYEFIKKAVYPIYVEEKEILSSQMNICLRSPRASGCSYGGHPQTIPATFQSTCTPSNHFAAKKGIAHTNSNPTQASNQWLQTFVSRRRSCCRCLWSTGKPISGAVEAPGELRLVWKIGASPERCQQFPLDPASHCQPPWQTRN